MDQRAIPSPEQFEAMALAQMTAAVWDPEGKVDRGFKRIIAHVASRTAGCQYCMAHTAGGTLQLAAVWEYPNESAV